MCGWVCRERNRDKEGKERRIGRGRRRSCFYVFKMIRKKETQILEKCTIIMNYANL